MNGAAFLGVDVDEPRVRRRVDTGYCDGLSHDLDEALALVEAARRERRALSVGLVGNIAEVLPALVRRGVVVDVLTDQTSAHDLRVGYIPVGLSLEQAGVRSRRRKRAQLKQHAAEPGDGLASERRLQVKVPGDFIAFSGSNN